MSSGNFDLTTYYAKRIKGDNAADTAATALIQTGRTDVGSDLWILSQTTRLNAEISKTYGIKYKYDATNGHDKIEFHGKTSNDNATAWIQLDTGDISGTWKGTAVAIDYGGTGATTAADARTNLGLGTAATKDSGYFALASHGNHVPTTATADNLKFLRCDNSWYKITKTEVNTMINMLDTGDSDLTANDYVITQYVGGGTTTTTYHRRPASKVVNATLVKAALGTVSTTAKKFLKDTGSFVQVDWDDLSGKPSTFAPSSHSHTGLVQRTSLAKGSNPSSDIWTLGSWAYETGTGTAVANRLTGLEGYINTSGRTAMRLIAYKNEASSSTANQLGCWIDKNGTMGYIVSDAAAFRSTIGLGTAATHAHEDYALASHGTHVSLANVQTALSPVFTISRADHSGDTGMIVNNTTSGSPLKIGYIVGSSGNGGIYDYTHAAWKVQIATNGTTTFTGSLSGNATSATTAEKVIHTATGVSYIQGARGDNAAVFAKKATGSVWYPAVALQTSGGGAWQIGNYNNETLEFQYATKANVDSQTNTTSEIYMTAGDTGRVATSENVGTGDSNGQVKIAGTNVSVKGLGSAAYTASTDYATSGHNHDSTYLKLSGGTLTGQITFDFTGSTKAKQTIYSAITLKYKTTNNANTYTLYPIRYMGNDESDVANNGILLYGSTSGMTWLSAGESGSTLPTKLSYNNENLYLSADGNIEFYTSVANDGTTYSRTLYLSGGTATVGSSALTGQVSIWNTTANHYVTITPASDLSANRTWTIPNSAGNRYFVGSSTFPFTKNAVFYAGDTTYATQIASANGALYATAANGALSWGTLPIAQGGTGKTTAADAWTALGGGASGKHADSYFVQRAGDTMTGTLTLKANQYYYNSVSGINANNSDLIGLNCLQFGDSADTFREGIMFPNGTAYDCLAANGGAFYFRCATDGTPTVSSANANGKVYAANFYGDLTGNVTGNCSGSSGSCTGNAATATTAKAVSDQSTADCSTSNNGGTAVEKNLVWYGEKNGNGTMRIRHTQATDGTTKLELVARNYNSSASPPAWGGWRGITITANKDNTATYSVTSAANFRTAIGLGTAATHAHGDYALASHGTHVTAANVIAVLTPNFTISVANHSNDDGMIINNTTSNSALKLGYIIGTSGNGGIYDYTHSAWKVKIETNGTTTFSGNASTATKLATARTIWGQSFDGSGNITGSLTAVGNIHNKNGTIDITQSNNGLSSNTGNGFYGLDKNGKDYTRALSYALTSGETRLYLQVRNHNGSAYTSYGGIIIKQGKSANTITYEVTDAANFRSAIGVGASGTHADSYFALASHGTHVSAANVKSALGCDTSTTTKWLNQKGEWSTPTAANVGAATSGHTHTSFAAGLKILKENSSHEGGQIVLEAASSSYNTAYIDLYNNSVRIFKNGACYFDYDINKGQLVLSNSTDAAGSSANNVALIVGGAQSSDHLEFDANEIIAKSNGTTKVSLWLNENAEITASGQVKNAIWNDYAEYRQVITQEPGRVCQENDNGCMTLSNKRLIPGCSVISDTYGYAEGETEKAKTPIAVSGRVLAYPYRAREEYHAGMAVCSAPNGTIDIMTREEIRDYPDAIIGIVSEIPDYEIWGTGNAQVNGRIWIKVR